jgi:hypothetical protein
MLELIVRPREVIRWDDFLKFPGYAIALDGFVYGPTRFSQKGPHLNLNHHEEVDRLSTRSTCAQVMVVAKMGLCRRFKKNGEFFAQVYINDPDQDTAMAIWLLRNHERIIGFRSEPLINRLVFANDMLDATAGSYPFDPESKVYGDMAWIFKPYTEARLSGHLKNMTAGEMEAVIDAIGKRIDDYTMGKGEKRQLDKRYEQLIQSDEWTLVREIGSDARTKMFLDGIYSFVSLRVGEDGINIYSIGSLSPFEDFPLDIFYPALNEAEGILPEEMDRWGGGNTIGGSPRDGGSKLSPEEVARIINESLKKYRSE